MGVYKATPVSTEMQTREWFVVHIDEFDYDVVESQMAFPDYLLCDRSGSLVRCEVEYESKNFIAHRHDPKGCDLVICWLHNAKLPLPVLELFTGKLYKASYIPKRIPKYQEFLRSLAVAGSPVTSLDYARAGFQRSKRRGLPAVPFV